MSNQMNRVGMELISGSSWPNYVTWSPHVERDVKKINLIKGQVELNHIRSYFTCKLQCHSTTKTYMSITRVCCAPSPAYWAHRWTWRGLSARFQERHCITQWKECFEKPLGWLKCALMHSVWRTISASYIIHERPKGKEATRLGWTRADLTFDFDNKS